MEKAPLEIERKYLIRYPDPALLRAQPGCCEVQMEQVYLTASEPGISRRVRRWTENGRTDYHYTEKRRLSAVTREEKEREITQEEFCALRDTQADPACRPIVKTRFRIPYRGQCVEIDLMPFWSHQALAEVELTAEDQPVFLPPYLTVLREVTEDHRYTNRALSKQIAEEDAL